MQKNQEAGRGRWGPPAMAQLAPWIIRPCGCITPIYSPDGKIYLCKPASISIDDANWINRHFVRKELNSEFRL